MARRWSSRGLLTVLFSCSLLGLLGNAPASGHSTRIASTSAYANAVIADSPVAYWRLNETSGTTASDETGHGYSGSIVGNPTLGVTPGAVADDTPTDTAFAFSGSTQFVRVPPTGSPPISALNPSPQPAGFSVEAWVKAPSAGMGTYRPAVSSFSGSAATSNASGYILSASSNNFWVFQAGAGTSTPLVSGPVSIAANTWTHLVGTVDVPAAGSLRLRLYVNSVLAMEQTFTATFAANTANPLKIGGSLTNADEVAVYNTALSASQIAAHFSKAAIFDVNTTEDSPDATPDGVCADMQSGLCSLRAAIMEADVLAGPVMITVPGGLYKLTQGPADDEGCPDGAEPSYGDLDIYAPVTITGAGSASTIIQMDTLSPATLPGLCGLSVTADRIIDIDNGGAGTPAYDGLNVTITGVTLRNGSAPVGSSFYYMKPYPENGGAIRYSGLNDTGKPKGTLTLKDCAIQNNTAAGNGGGVYAFNGGLAISNCTFSGNRAHGSGGAIYTTFGPPSFLRNSTFSGNGADLDGGGLLLAGGTLTTTNVTITNNRADADGNGKGTGGGVNVTSGTLTLQNTIVADDFSGTGTTASDIAGTVNSTSSFNLIGTGGAGGLTNGTNSNKVGVANPGLGPLANNGGPTETHALRLGSPALDAGSNALASTLTNDQRGAPFARVHQGAGSTSALVDIGALEQHPSISAIAAQQMLTNTQRQVSFSVGDGFDSISASSNASSSVVANLSVSATAGSPGSAGSGTLTITSGPSGGTAQVTVTVTSTVGGQTLSMPSPFLLTVNAPPTATLTAPTTGTLEVAPSSITVKASASDPDSDGVAKVDFYDNGTLIGTDMTSPYSFTWSGPTVTVGVHSLTAKATDNGGATTTSKAVPIMVYAASSTYVSAVLADSPLGYWRLDENLGTTLFDRTGHKYTGSFIGSPTPGATGALVDPDKAVSFSGTSQYAQVGVKTALNPAPPFTIEAWVKVTGGSNTNRFLVNSAAGSPARGYRLVAAATPLNANVWRFDVGGGGTSFLSITGPAVPSSTTWTHLVGTVDVPTSGSLHLTLYVNGVLAKQQTFTSTTFSPNTTSALKTGAAPAVVDDVAFYGTALSLTRVQAHYNTGKNG